MNFCLVDSFINSIYAVVFITRRLLEAVLAITMLSVNPSVRPSVRPSVTLVYFQTANTSSESFTTCTAHNYGFSSVDNHFSRYDIAQKCDEQTDGRTAVVAHTALSIAACIVQ